MQNWLVLLLNEWSTNKYCFSHFSVSFFLNQIIAHFSMIQPIWIHISIHICYRRIINVMETTHIIRLVPGKVHRYLQTCTWNQTHAKKKKTIITPRILTRHINRYQSYHFHILTEQNARNLCTEVKKNKYNIHIDQNCKKSYTHNHKQKSQTLYFKINKAQSVIHTGSDYV